MERFGILRNMGKLRGVCGKRQADGSFCTNAAGCQIRHSVSGAAASDDLAVPEAARQALADTVHPISDIGWARRMELMRDISYLPLDGPDARGEALIDKFAEECILGSGDLERWATPKGLGGLEYHMLRNGISNRGARKKWTRFIERSWWESETAQQVRLAGDAIPLELELRECVEAAQYLEASGKPYGREEISVLVERRRRALLGRRTAQRLALRGTSPDGPFRKDKLKRRNAAAPTTLALEACAYGQYAQESVFRLYGANSGTAQAAARHVSQRCRQTYFEEAMTTPRLPAKPEPTWDETWGEEIGFVQQLGRSRDQFALRRRPMIDGDQVVGVFFVHGRGEFATEPLPSRITDRDLISAVNDMIRNHDDDFVSANLLADEAERSPR